MSTECIASTSIFSEKGIKTIEERYNAKYLIDTAMPAGLGGWTDFPGAIFYQYEAYPETGSHYFAMYMEPYSENIYITDASFIENTPINFVKDPVDGCLIHSAFRHDYVTYGTIMVDGGRDYLRTSGVGEIVRMVIQDGEWVELNLDYKDNNNEDSGDAEAV
jgi:hypothetical protein